MTCYLAPERPCPSSVISESYYGHFKDFSVIRNDRWECLFGDEYERELCFYLAKHTEANCDDRVCLIGEEFEWTTVIQERLFLHKTIDFIDCNLQPKLIEQRLSNNKFDRIILLNCLHRITSRSISPVNLLHRSLTNDGRLIILYREPYRNTLPIPIPAIRKWLEIHSKSARLIEQIYREKQGHRIEMFEKIETIQFKIKKYNWFRLLYHRKFYPLTLIDQKQIIDGLRQLNETYFKYHHDLVEIHEQLSFLIIEKTSDVFDISGKQLEQKTLFHRLRNSPISITDEITQLLNLKQQNKN